jgi:hypothetical protein
MGILENIFILLPHYTLSYQLQEGKMFHRFLEGFIKADSNNIPVVDIHMFSGYIKKDSNFIAPEYVA